MKYEPRPYGWWARFARRYWSVIRPPGRLGRVISIRPTYTGISVTVRGRWGWTILGPTACWYYRCRPMRLRPLDHHLDFGQGD